jgi:hypothetical protein
MVTRTRVPATGDGRVRGTQRDLDHDHTAEMATMRRELLTGSSGTALTGAASNGAHAANGLAARFNDTGQGPPPSISSRR